MMQRLKAIFVLKEKCKLAIMRQKPTKNARSRYSAKVFAHKREQFLADLIAIEFRRWQNFNNALRGRP